MRTAFVGRCPTPHKPFLKERLDPKNFNKKIICLSRKDKLSFSTHYKNPLPTARLLCATDYGRSKPLPYHLIFYRHSSLKGKVRFPTLNENPYPPHAFCD